MVVGNKGGTESIRKYVTYDNVRGCIVRGYMHEAGVIHVGILIKTRTDEEELLLMDLVERGCTIPDQVRRTLCSAVGFSRYAQFPG
jgi:hypothetical protein